MQHMCNKELAAGPRRVAEVPIFRQTTCEVCGADQGVGVRYRDAVLCLDCYRRAKREARAERRRLEELVCRAIAVDSTDAVARRLARLYGLARRISTASGRSAPRQRVSA